MGPDRGRRRTPAASHDGGGRAAPHPRGDGSHPQRAVQAPRRAGDPGRGAAMRRAWLPAGVALVLALALASRASAAERLSALDPVEIYANGFDDLRGVVVDPQGNVFVAGRAAGTVTRPAPNPTRTGVRRRLP